MYSNVSKGAKIRNRYNQVSHLPQDTNGKVTHSQLYTTNKGQEVSPFPAGDHKAQITDAHKHKRSTALEWSVNILLEGLNQFHGANLALYSDVDQYTFKKVTKHKKT